MDIHTQEGKLSICKGISMMPNFNILDINTLKFLLEYYNPSELVEKFIHSFPRCATEFDECHNKLEIKYLNCCWRSISSIGFGADSYNKQFIGYPEHIDDMVEDLPIDNLPPPIPHLTRSNAYINTYQRLEFRDGKPYQWVDDYTYWSVNFEEDVDFEHAFLIWKYLLEENGDYP